MKNILRTILLLTLVASLHSCVIDNDIIPEDITSTTRPTPPFDGVDIRDGFKANISWGPRERVIVEVPDEIQRYVYTDVYNGELRVTLDKGINPGSVRVKQVYIELPYLNSILASNNAEVYSPNRFSTNIFNIDVTSGAYVKAQIDSDRLEAIATDASDIEVYGDAGTIFTKEISGNSQFLGFKLHANNADLFLLGQSLAEVYTTNNLKVEASGQSTVRFIGFPSIIHKLSGGSQIVDYNR